MRPRASRRERAPTRAKSIEAWRMACCAIPWGRRISHAAYHMLSRNVFRRRRGALPPKSGRPMPRVHLASWLIAAAVGVLCGGPGHAAGADERPTRHEIWDLKLGAKIDAQPDDFIDYACGTNG